MSKVWLRQKPGIGEMYCSCIDIVVGTLMLSECAVLRQGTLILGIWSIGCFLGHLGVRRFFDSKISTVGLLLLVRCCAGRAVVVGGAYGRIIGAGCGRRFFMARQRRRADAWITCSWVAWPGAMGRVTSNGRFGRSGQLVIAGVRVWFGRICGPRGVVA